MDIHTLLTTTGKSDPASAASSRHAGAADDQAFARLFSQASSQTSGLTGKPIDGGRELLDARHTQLPTASLREHALDGSGPALANLAPLTQGIAQANSQLGLDHDAQTLLDMLPLDNDPDLSLETLVAATDQPALQQQLLAIAERMNLIDAAGQGIDPESLTEQSRTAWPQVGAESDGDVDAEHIAPLLAALSPGLNADSAQRQTEAREPSRHQVLASLQALTPQATTTTASGSQGDQSAPGQPVDALMRDASFASRLGIEDGSLANHKEPASFAALNGQNQGTSTSASPTSTPNPTVTQSAVLSAPVGTAQWQQHLGQQLIGLHQRGGQQIDLHLNPAELGPLSISLKMGEHGAQAQFLSANAQVRAAVEQAIPQLREALEEQGISLGEAMVGEHPQQQKERSPFAAGLAESSGGSLDADSLPGDTGSTLPSQALDTGLNGRVDLYA